MRSGSYAARTAPGLICLTKSAAFLNTCDVLRFPGVTTPMRLPQCVFTRPMPSARFTVVADHDGGVVRIEPTVVEQMHREVDIRAVLFGLHTVRKHLY